MIPERVARHEAGHAVMRWILGLSATALVAREDGSGLCAGTGDVVRRDDLIKVSLAGPAAEIREMFAILDWEGSRFWDFDEARRLEAVWLPANMVETSVRSQFRSVCEELVPHDHVIDAIAERLIGSGSLSAEVVAALCQERAPRAGDDELGT